MSIIVIGFDLAKNIFAVCRERVFAYCDSDFAPRFLAKEIIVMT